MKNIIALLLLAACCSSCENTWDEDSRDMFRQSCLENAERLTPSKAQADKYCDCVLEKTMKKYPHVADALEHSDSLITDPDIQACKSLLGHK